MKKLIFWIFILLVNSMLTAQRDTNQHSFAQTYFGVGSHFMLGGSVDYLDSLGLPQRVDLPTSWQPKLIVGGLHFWKRVDIYVSFSLPNVKWDNASGIEHKYSAGIETGARYYPWKIKHGTISPYFGLNWGVINYSHKANGMLESTKISRQVLNLETGLAFRHKGFIMECNFQYMATHSFSYATSRLTRGNLDFSALSVGVSYKYSMDFTRGSSSPGVRRFNHILDSVLVEKKWNNAFHIGIGPSAAFGMAKSNYNTIHRPFLDDPLPVTILPDFCVGYYIDKPAIDISLSFRPMIFNQRGFGFEQELLRLSTGIEITKFIFNYKGFVPFVGAFGSYEYLKLTEKDNGVLITEQEQHLPGWGLILGWDIQPNKSDWWILRTNIRFTPYIDFRVNNEKYQLSQWEFNFIQFVIYPQRLIAVKQLNKQ